MTPEDITNSVAAVVVIISGSLAFISLRKAIRERRGDKKEIEILREHLRPKPRAGRTLDDVPPGTRVPEKDER